MKPFSSPANKTVTNVATLNHPRSKFNRSKNLKTSFNSSIVYPIYKELVVPGDTVDMNMHNFVRMNPTVAPFMDNVYVDTHFFFVPLRLVWDNFQKFMGERKSPSDSIDYVIPTVTSPAVTGWATASPAAHMGMRQGVPNITHSSLPLRAFNLIYNEWFRDQNLQTPLVVDTNDGPDTATDYSTLPQRNKFHDYFTTCFTAPQKGPSVMIPTNDELSVIGKNMPFDNTNAGNNKVQVRDSGGTLRGIANTNTNSTIYGLSSSSGTGELIVDMTDNTAATINALRLAEAVQSLLETDARGGTRYIEMMRAHFGVISSDARLQRPEYLGGNSVPLSMMPVVQNSETATTPQGNLAGMGVLNSHNARFIKSFEEHGYIIGVVSARSDISYQQGADRDWFYETRYDIYLPELANIGEQAVLNKEIFAQGTSADENVFGYQERWSEMRQGISRVTGTLNSDASSSLDFWHLAQDFAALPVLNTSFIKDGTPELRILEVTSESAFVGDFHFETYWTRRMPMFSIPQMGSRF